MMEKVLVFKLENLKKFNINNDKVTWISREDKDIDIFLNECLNNSFYIDRDMAENNSLFKQVIPYCILRQGENIFLYKRSRSGGEKRLYDMWSFGIGGHINLEDKAEDPHVSFGMALQREIAEELNFSNPELMENAEYEITGLIYDKSNSVGMVHFGVIVEVEVPENIIVVANSDEISESKWITVEELLESDDEFPEPKYKLENWSESIFLSYLNSVSELILK